MHEFMQFYVLGKVCMVFDQHAQDTIFTYNVLIYPILRTRQESMVLYKNAHGPRRIAMYNNTSGQTFNVTKKVETVK